MPNVVIVLPLRHPEVARCRVLVAVRCDEDVCRAYCVRVLLHRLHKTRVYWRHILRGRNNQRSDAAEGSFEYGKLSRGLFAAGTSNRCVWFCSRRTVQTFAVLARKALPALITGLSFRSQYHRLTAFLTLRAAHSRFCPTSPSSQNIANSKITSILPFTPR